MFFALIIGALTVMPSLFSANYAEAALTQAQIDAVNALLKSFGVDEATISNVNATLSGKPIVTSTTAVWCHDFNTNLKVGDSNAEVSALKTVLQKEGLDSSTSMTFDEDTASAVSGFQQKYASEILAPVGLKYGTGFVGPSTRAKLNKLYGCKTVTPPPLVVTPPVVTPVTPTPVTPTSPTVTPSITVLSPNGGEVWETGKGYDIRWSNKNPLINSAADIQLYKGGSSVLVIDTKLGNNLSENVYRWTIPSNLIPSNDYKIVIFGGGTNMDSSDAAFSIMEKQTSAYPGFYMQTDKKSYSINDVVSLTLKRADGKLASYMVDLYSVSTTGGEQVLIQPNLSVSQNTVTNIKLSDWPLFKNGNAGDYLLLVCAAGEKCNAGVNTNSTFFTLTSGSTTNLPDLIISDFSWTPSSPKSVENITVNVKVKNAGSAAAQNFSVTNLWDSNGKEINISSLAAGGETTIQGTIGGLSHPGPNAVTMSVDALNKVAESNEANNSLNKTINVSPVYVGDGLATLKHWETWQLNNGYILYADGGNVFGQTPYKVNFRIYDPKANYQVIATSPDLKIGESWALASQNISIKVNEINVYSPGNANWSVKLTASSVSVQPSSPKLNVSVSAMPVSQNIIAGSQNVTFANYILDAWQSSEDIRVTSLRLLYQTRSGGSATNLTNCSLYDGLEKLNTGVNIINPLYTGTHVFDIDLGRVWRVPKGENKNLALKCDVAGNASGEYAWGLSVTANINAVGLGSGNAATVIVASSNGQVMTITPVTTPTSSVINSISPNSSSYVTGATASFSWARTGDFSKANSYYFVYLKQGPNQILGGTAPSPAYTALVFRSATLDYPSFNVVIPNGTTPGTYYIELDYADSNGNPIASITSSAFTITTSTSSILPAPTGLSASVLSNGMFSLSWNDNSSNEDGFKIEQRDGIDGTWAGVSTTMANIHSASFGSAKPNIQYYFRVKSYNTAGESYSGEASAIMTVNVPIPPSYLSAVPVSSSQINLAWSDNSANEGGFVIEYKQGSAGLWTALISNLSANNTQYTVSSLNGGTTYYFRIKAYNSAGESVYSSEASAITQPLANDTTNTTGAPLAIGDVSKDSKVDVADAMFVAQYVVGSRTFDSAQLIAADVNKDGKVTTNDAKIIAQYVAGKYSSLPVTSVKVGDVNQNNQIDIGDPMFIAQYLAGNRTFGAIQEAAADVNNDSVITQEDADIISKALIGIITDLPYTGTTSFVPSASQQSASILNAIWYILK